jgi:hypothetical protein
LFESYLEKTRAFLGAPVESGLRRPGFVAFHLDKAESLASAGKNIGFDIDGTDRSEFREHGADGCFTGFCRQVANEEFLHASFLNRFSGAEQKIPAQWRGSSKRN